MTTLADVYDALKYHVEVDRYGIRTYRNAAGQLHREDGPAIVYANGGKEWYRNGLRHRDVGPAVERANGYKEWNHNGHLHRINGPAIEYPNGSKEWYINGKELTEAEFLAATQPVVEMTVADIEKLPGKRVKIIK